MTDKEPFEVVEPDEKVDDTGTATLKIGVIAAVGIVAVLLVASAMLTATDDTVRYTMENDASKNVRYNLSIGYWQRCAEEGAFGCTTYEYGWIGTHEKILDPDEADTHTHTHTHRYPYLEYNDSQPEIAVRVIVERPDGETTDKLAWASKPDTVFTVTDFGLDCNCRWDPDWE